MLATESTKTALENAVSATFANSGSTMGQTNPIQTKKYLTPDNRLIYLTLCKVAESAVPRVRIQVLWRVEGGVHEAAYALFADHRFERSDNPMVFGTTAGTQPTAKSEPVDEETTQQLIGLVQSLASLKQVL